MEKGQKCKKYGPVNAKSRHLKKNLGKITISIYLFSRFTNELVTEILVNWNIIAVNWKYLLIFSVELAIPYFNYPTIWFNLPPAISIYRPPWSWFLFAFPFTSENFNLPYSQCSIYRDLEFEFIESLDMGIETHFRIPTTYRVMKFQFTALLSFNLLNH